MARRPVMALAVAMLIGGMAVLSPPTLRAAENGLRIVSQTRYTALPAQKRVHVTVDARATNVTPDPPNGRYYYTDAHFALQPAIRNLTASSGGATLAARTVSATKEFTEIAVAFGRGLFHNQSIAFRFSFDIVDPGGVPQRDVRIASSLVAFPIWAFGSEGTPGSAVTVVIPANYRATVTAGDLTDTHPADGSTILSSSSITDPTAFFAYVTAERPGAYASTSLSVPLPGATVTVRIRAWDDDRAWGTKQAKLVKQGLPALQRLIGLDFGVRGTLVVEEAAGLRLGDYAGVYNDVTEVIDIRYDADDITTLHETAHTWFNSRLFDGRWIGEAFAEYYAVQAAHEIGVTGQIFSLTPELRKARIALNTWGRVGEEPPNTEDYGYAATYELATLIANRAGNAGLQRVWRAATDGEASYQSAPTGEPPERGVSATVDGWQRLLDLLEERSSKPYGDLWKTWVVTPEQQSLLSKRTSARTDYQRTMEAAGDWRLPYQIRYEMGAWQFDEVTSLLTDARGVLADRDRIAAAAAALDLAVPDTVKTAFQTGQTFDAARQDARAEEGALTVIAAAGHRLDMGESPTEWVGLLFEQPAAALDAARSAFERGDADAARREAGAATSLRNSATDVGRLRVGVVGGSLLLLDGAAMAMLALRRRRRRQGVLMAQASPTFPSMADVPGTDRERSPLT
jgi:hypothetical protein